MINYTQLYQKLALSPLEGWIGQLPTDIENALHPSNHGELLKWEKLLHALPKIQASTVKLNQGTIQVCTTNNCDSSIQDNLKVLLKQFHPWRKGPYDLFGITIDTEWRSDWKWDRLSDEIKPLTNRWVLDVGCGNGYHCWRMRGAGAACVIGIDPTLLYVMQYQAINHFINDDSVFVLPIGIENLPRNLTAFDTIFSMGILYHRRSPLEHLCHLHTCLREGGELVLETLVIDGIEGQVFQPQKRYAKMRNVWFIPSCDTLASWLKQCGFDDIKLIDVTTTTTDEQRQTDWMTFESLAHFLDPVNPDLTVEGFPAPKRAIVLSTKS